MCFCCFDWQPSEPGLCLFYVLKLLDLSDKSLKFTRMAFLILFWYYYSSSEGFRGFASDLLFSQALSEVSTPLVFSIDKHIFGTPLVF